MDWQLGDVFLTMCVFFAWVLWFWLLFAVFGDLFRRHDIGGGAKTGWIVFVIVLPFVGAFVYLISQSHGMGERRAAEIQAAQAQGARSEGPAAEIGTAKQLLDSGAINQAEFDAMKAKALAA